MKKQNRIQQTIGVIKSLYTTTKQRLLSLLAGSLEKTDVVSKIRLEDGNCNIFRSVLKREYYKKKYYKPMSLLWSKNGFRGEYLARYIVSRFAFISESSVGEDYGIDFYCGLNKEVHIDGKDYIKYDKAFYLQIKTKTKENYASGSYTKPKTFLKGQTIPSLETPLFIGFLDLVEQRLDIHTASTMWYPYMLNRAKEISLNFRNGDKNENLQLLKPFSPQSGIEHKVDLGLPIISIKFSEIEKLENVDIYRKILSDVIDIELENIVSKRLGLAYFRWVCEHTTNIPESFRFGYKFINSADDSSFGGMVDSMIDDMQQYVVALALTAKNEGKFDIYDKIRNVTTLVSKEKQYSDVVKLYPELYDINLDYDRDGYTPIATSGMTYTHTNNPKCELVIPEIVIEKNPRNTKHKVRQTIGKPNGKKV